MLWALRKVRSVGYHRRVHYGERWATKLVHDGHGWLVEVKREG